MAEAPRGKRFAIAFTFTRAHRDFLRQVADALAASLTRERILFDQYHETKLAKVDGGLTLLDWYKSESELVVVALSKDYGHADNWTRLEWPQVVGLASERKDAVLLLRMDETLPKHFSGLSDLSFSIDARARRAKELAALLLKAWKERGGTCGADRTGTAAPLVTEISAETAGGVKTRAVATLLPNGRLITAQRWLLEAADPLRAGEPLAIELAGRRTSLRLVWSGGARFDAMVLEKHEDRAEQLLGGTPGIDQACMIYGTSALSGRIVTEDNKHWVAGLETRHESSGAPVFQGASCVGFLETTTGPAARIALTPFDELARDLRWSLAVGSPLGETEQKRLDRSRRALGAALEAHGNLILPEGEHPATLRAYLAEKLCVADELDALTDAMLLAPGPELVKILSVARTKADDSNSATSALLRIACLVAPWSIDLTDPRQRAHPDHAPALRYAGTNMTVAEILVAGHEERPASFRLDTNKKPVGKAAINDTLDQGIDESGSVTVESAMVAMARQGVLRTDAPSHARSVRRNFELRAREGLAHKAEPPPYLVVDAAAKGPKTVAAIKAKLPDVQVVLLEQDDRLKDRDYDIALDLSTLLDSASSSDRNVK